MYIYRSSVEMNKKTSNSSRCERAVTVSRCHGRHVTAISGQSLVNSDVVTSLPPLHRRLSFKVPPPLSLAHSVCLSVCLSVLFVRSSRLLSVCRAMFSTLHCYRLSSLRHNITLRQNAHTFTPVTSTLLHSSVRLLCKVL